MVLFICQYLFKFFSFLFQSGNQNGSGFTEAFPRGYEASKRLIEVASIGKLRLKRWLLNQ